MIDLEIAIRTCERESRPYVGSEQVTDLEKSYQRSHQAAAAILRRVQSLDPVEREELVRDVERVQALELLGMKRRQLRPNISLTFRRVVDDAFQQIGAVIVVTMQPDRSMWPLRLTVDPACADHYAIDEVSAWNDAILRGPLSGRMFPPAPFSPENDWPYENLRRPYAAVEPGVNVVVRAQVIQVPAPPFAGAIYGSTLFPNPGGG